MEPRTKWTKIIIVFARGQYGDSEFEHDFFDNLNYDEFESFVLRNSGQDWLRSNMKDIMLTSLMRVLNWISKNTIQLLHI